jgi:hypothetical protein
MSDNTKWFSQTLLTFKDKSYSTEGYLRLAISTNTEDYKFFNPPLFNISISNSNNFQKTSNLNIQNAEDLVLSFEKILKQANGHELVIEKHYNKLAKLYFKFAVESTSQTRVVAIEIYSNESDATKVIVPLQPTFQSFLNRLKFFVNNYDQLCMNLLNHSISNETFQIIQQLPNLIKGISSQIVSRIPEEDIIQDSRAPVPALEATDETATVTYDFDKFLGDNMDNIHIPEIEEHKIEKKLEEPTVEMKSSFITKILKNDLSNLESKLNSFSLSPNPVFDFANDLSTQLGFDIMAGIDDDDKKSIAYLSKLMIDVHTKDYTINQTPIPDKITMLKFSCEASDERVSLAKDILTLIGYMRTVRRRLENKFSNPYDNKGLVYIYMRHIMDPFCFSYLQKFTNSEITASITNRYNYFEKIGVFSKYTELLKETNCSPITKVDLDMFANEVYDSIIKTPFVKELHGMMYSANNIRVPSKNTFNLEQIINEIVSLEVAEKLGANFKDAGVVNKFKDNGISDEILKIFIKDKKIEKSTGIKIKKITPLERVIEKFKQDIPEQYRDEVVDYIKKLEYNKFDFVNCKWPLIEFDQRVVVAFYVWDPESDPEMKINFAHFMSLVENEQMTKDDIILATQKISEETKSFGFEELNFE